MKFGGNPKQYAMLGGLVLVGGYVLYSNFAPDTPSSSAAAPVARVAAPVSAIAPSASSDAPVSTRSRRVGRTRPSNEWHPGIDGRPLDPLKVDPTLRLDLLAKVQHVEVGGSQRNLFQFAEAAPVTPVNVAPLPKVAKINTRPTVPTPVVPSGPPPKPAPPPITLKYYGFASPRSSPRKKAFFLDGDEIIVAAEGDLMKKRYKLVKIGINSVTVEDTQFNNEQVLPLAEDANG